ncbi:MAG TPA: acetoin utilization protein AcuC [Actinomycetota bacterium]
MSERVAIVWDDQLAAYDFGPQHPLKPVRVKLTVELSRAYGILDLPNVAVHTPVPATREQLEMIHDPSYIDAVEQISATAERAFANYGWGIGMGDNPAFRGMHEASALVAGASLTGARLVHDGAVEHVFNPAGGLHHAMRDRASGFCIYDDPAIAIEWLLRSGHERIAYVDVDVHHGDGVQAAFYDDPRVMTISLHESGEFLFPGTGFPSETGADGTSVNVALPPMTGDDAYREAFDEIVPPLVEAFRPSILVTQLGCDTHATDPLAHLALTTRTYRHVAAAFHDLAHRLAGGRWLAVGGGGYQIYTVVPRAWTLYAAELAGVELDPAIPAQWIDVARSLGAQGLPAMIDDPQVVASPGRMEEARDGTRAATAATKRAVFGFHGLA